MGETRQLKINNDVELSSLLCVFGCDLWLGLPLDSEVMLMLALFKSEELGDLDTLLHLGLSLFLSPLVHQTNPFFCRFVPLHHLLVASVHS